MSNFWAEGTTYARTALVCLDTRSYHGKNPWVQSYLTGLTAYPQTSCMTNKVHALMFGACCITLLSCGPWLSGILTVI
jgi:hypothetical protein